LKVWVSAFLKADDGIDGFSERRGIKCSILSEAGSDMLGVRNRNAKSQTHRSSLNLSSRRRLSSRTLLRNDRKSLQTVLRNNVHPSFSLCSPMLHERSKVRLEVLRRRERHQQDAHKLPSPEQALA
jgi:hypothetical protein